MNVLYICKGKIANNIFHSASWIEGVICEFNCSNLKEKYKLTVAFADSDIKKQMYIKNNIDNIDYYPFASNWNSKSILDKEKTSIGKIIKKVKPDIIHLFGTEFSFSLATVQICKELNMLDKILVSIQGIISIIYKHYYSNLPNKVIYGFTLRDIIKLDNIYLQAKKYKNRGKNEIKVLENIKFITGRTSFDKAVTLQINPKLKYFKCNEILRPVFYLNKWNIEKCTKHSIFISQNYYPIKGMHILLEAMTLILKNFPNAHIYTTGNNPLSYKGITKRIYESNYNRYLRKFLTNNKLENNVTYLGYLTEKEMCKQYLKSNVHVCTSSIENSPNSLGEAMILGVPSVVSNVGGIPDLFNHKEDGLIYSPYEPYMLAYHICEIFKHTEKAEYYSENSRKHAMNTYNKNNNFRELCNIYNIIGGSND